MTTHKPLPHTWSNNNITLAWLGHAAFLLNFFGTRILIDPALEKRIGISPIGSHTIGPKRFVAAPLGAKEAGNIDLLLLSHAHTDHFDYPSLRSLQSLHTSVVTAKNTAALWKGMNYASIHELHWGESRLIADTQVTAIEGKHWGARLPWQKSMQANSLLISKNSINIFFSGDTGYTEKIHQQLAGIPIHLAIMGIAAYAPKAFEAHHATPEQAWKMSMEIGADWVIPMHWGTFRLSQEPMTEPIVRFRQAASGNLAKIPVQEIGATWVMPL
ncbi:MAG: MBL fold metallo-hydrolase [Peptococcaceae bacterium]|nr:MBL fold metallo-hydrolase [Peptococcaceae bacterium]